MTDKELEDFIHHGETGFLAFAMMFGDGWAQQAIDIAKELRARLEQLEQEPVAWMEFEGYMDEDGLMSERKVLHTWDNGKGEPLYTAPPQREWQGLTDEEIQEMWSDHCKNWQRAGKILISPTVFGNAIEAKLKEKNT